MLVGGIAGAAIGHYGWGIIDNALGRPFQLWGAKVDKENEGAIRHAGYRGNRQYTNLLPNPDAIMKAWRAGLLTSWSAAPAIIAHGIQPPPDMLSGAPPWVRALLDTESRIHPDERDWLGRIWDNVAYMGMSRPDAGTVAQLSASKRISATEASSLRAGLDASWVRYGTAAGAQYQAPGFDTLLQLFRMGRISVEQYRLWSARAGWFDDEARVLQSGISTLPTPTEALIASWRGAITPAQLRTYGRAAGYVNDSDWAAVQAAQQQMPGPADLVRFSVREAWDEATVREWGYDEEFPAPFAAWMGWQGLNWGRSLTLPDGTRIPDVSWPKAYWRAHWQIISPEQAYRAFHLLRPGRIGRYAETAPGVTAFTAADLQRVLKVSDYPPKMRKWLAAMSTLPLDLRTVRQMFLLGLRDRAWVIEQILDRGLVREDAVAWADLLQTQRNNVASAAVRAWERGVEREAIRANLRAYREGWQERDETRANLILGGASPSATDKALALEDAEIHRADLTETLRAVRRQVVAGMLTEAETVEYLRRAGLTPTAAARSVARWRNLRTLERRSIAGTKALALAAEGVIPLEAARGRLAALGYLPADAQALLAEAEMRLVAKRTREAAALARQAKASARELAAARRQALAAVRQTESQLRRITPLSTLKRWLQSGIRKGAWIRQRLLAMGYDTSSIEGFLSEWTMEAEKQSRSESGAIPTPEKLVRRQTSLATVKRWWQDGVVTDSWTIRRMEAMGYSPESIALYRRDWRAGLTRKQPGPAPEPTANPPAVGVSGGGPTALHQEARPTHQDPRVVRPEARPNS